MKEHKPKNGQPDLLLQCGKHARTTMNSQSQSSSPEGSIIPARENRPSPEELANLFDEHWGKWGNPPRFHVDSAGRIFDRRDNDIEICYDALASYTHDALVDADPQMAVKVLAAITHGDKASLICFGIETLYADELPRWATAIVNGPKSVIPVYVDEAIRNARIGRKGLLLALIRASDRAGLNLKSLFGDDVLKEFTADLL